MCLLFICVTGSEAKLLMMLSLLMQLLLVVDTAVLMMVTETSACSEDRQTCGMREGRDVMWGGRDGRGEDILLMLFYQTLEAVAVCRGVEITGRWMFCQTIISAAPDIIQCARPGTQRPCSHPGHSHFQGHCQIVQFIISVSTYVHGHRLYTVKPRCLLTSAIVDFFSEKKLSRFSSVALDFASCWLLRKQRATLPLSCRVFLLCEHLPAREAKQFRCCPVFSCLFVDNYFDNW